MKLFIKAGIALILIGLLVWDAGVSSKSITEPVDEAAIYGQYTAYDEIGVYREAEVTAFIPISVDIFRYGSMSTKSAYHCIAILADNSIGLIKLDCVQPNNPLSSPREDLPEYSDWIVDLQAFLYGYGLSGETVTVRGQTVELSDEDISALESASIRDYIPEFADAEYAELALLDTTKQYKYIPEETGLKGMKSVTVWMLVVVLLWMFPDLLRYVVKKKNVEMVIEKPPTNNSVINVPKRETEAVEKTQENIERVSGPAMGNVMEEGNTASAPSLSKEEALGILRRKIISRLAVEPEKHYQLADLMWENAAKCFPNSIRWDGAWFYLDLHTQKLYVEVSNYPSHSAAYEDEYPLTAAEFHDIAMRFHMAEELQCMETEADWEALYDDTFKVAVANAQTIWRMEEEEIQQEIRRRNVIVISEELTKQKPAMEFTRIEVKLFQNKGDTSIVITRNQDKYHIESDYRSKRISSESTNQKRELSSLEAVWVEQQVNRCLKDSNASQWQSMQVERMDVRIDRQGEPCVELIQIIPLRKYTNLQNALNKLAECGSVVVPESV